MIVFDAARPVFWSSNYNQDGVSDDGTRFCPTDAEHSSCYGGAPYDYVPGLIGRLYDVVHAIEQPLWKDCTQSRLGVVAELDNIDLNYCKFYGETRNKPTKEQNPNRKRTRAILKCLSLTPRLQRLSLCTDGFAPHGQYGCMYSCLPVILTAYNLPPKICISSEYMFLIIVIPSPSNPKCIIDIYLKLLIEELQMWHMGILTRDNAKNKIFTIRTAFMWTVNDLPAFGWSITGVMGYPICIKDTRAFYLENSRKRATLTSTDSFYPQIIPTIGTRKHSLRIE
ncbi:hypothetical protein Sango_1273500 [Sesamum angolense]|uniref:Uncharacterized protein n=1 Tax=Sesamum angolense TaxID=2727404 RepID=A0AAE1WR42_9LAMI|nr:hypothetical protein Sango_1273500 [Sesamum angolense]